MGMEVVAKNDLLIALAVMLSAMAASAVPEETMKFLADGAEAEVVVDEQGGLRTYALTSTATLRDNNPADGSIVVSESTGHPRLRSGNPMFDALYAMAIQEARQNSVDEIRDWAYANGEPIRIEAFQTGEKWTYVWTRDLAYSVHLALAGFDPQRSVNSLLFKTSPLKSSVSGGFVHQIIQDTGSGGSYPVSTDRVVWALGAWEALKYLDGAERQDFLQKVYPVLHDTIEQDRILVYDSSDGLYRGEESFLDWREQTYPGWTKEDVLPIALSKSLSVNVLNYALLSIAAECATHMQRPGDAERYAAWAAGLREAIRAGFYDSAVSCYSSYLLSDGISTVRAKRYDLLGNSLAVLFDIADPEQASAILEHYPVGPHGPPVVWPQERTVPIYHNQAIWPFVTAYWLKAAGKAEYPPAFRGGVRAMQIMAAINLSNMENYDFVSGRAEVNGPELSGPVINSRRQLWSVAGYLSVVQDNFFGLQTSWNGIRFRPYMTADMRNQCFPFSDTIELQDFSYRGTANTVRIHLPRVHAMLHGALDVGKMILNGEEIGSGFIPRSELQPTNRWEIVLEAREGDIAERPMHRIDVSDARVLYAPLQPQWDERHNGGITAEDGVITLHFSHPDKANLVFNIYRNGQCVAEHIRQTSWVDESASHHVSERYCYAVQAVDPESGNASHPTPFLSCSMDGAQTVIPAAAMKNRGGQLVDEHHFEAWGRAGDELRTAPFQVDRDGRYMVHAHFSNGSGPVNTGITCAVKLLEVLEGETDQVVASGYLVMPQSGSWERWDYSSPVRANLNAGKSYRLRIRENEHARNMSYLRMNESYTAWPGGGPDVFNQVNIAALRVELIRSGEYPDSTE